MNKNNDEEKLVNAIEVLLEKLSRVYDTPIDELRNKKIVIKGGSITINNK